MLPAKPRVALQDLFGVLLTPFDSEEKYTSETLGDGLSQDHSCRHLARIAHLYFARTAKLSVPDLEDNVPGLLIKLFGALPCDGTAWGWMSKSFAAAPGPNSWYDETQRDLVSTFDPNSKKWSKEHLAAFRMVQLMHPQEQANLLDVLVFRLQGQVTYLYPLVDLPVCLETAVAQVARGDSSSPIPDLVLMLKLAPSSQQLQSRGVVSGHISVDLPQYVLLRFTNWFAGCKRGGTGTGDSMPASTQLSQMVLHDVYSSLPCMEVLFAWCTKLLPLEQSPPPSGLFFRACIATLWLNRGSKGVFELPTLRLLLALDVVVTYLHTDPGLVVPAMSAAETSVRFDKLHRGTSPTLLGLRPALHTFLSNAIARMPCFGSPQLAHVIDLWSICLQPWRAKQRATDPGKRFAGLTPLQKISIFASPAKPSSATGPLSASGASLQATAASSSSVSVPAQMAPEWMWFIVQHYFLYSDLLNQVLARVHVEPNVGPDTLEAVARVFSTVFIDPVVCVLRACDLLLKGHTDVQMSALQSHLPPSCARDETCIACAKLMHEQRPIIVLALERQRTELNSKQVVLFGQRDDAQNVQQQLHWARKEAKHRFFASGDKALVSGLDRLRAVFVLPPVEDERAKADFARRFKESAGPAVEVVSGVPHWMRQQAAAFTYQRLSFAGQRQIETGELGGHAMLASQYLGNPLLNPPPPSTFESPWLIGASLALSRWINQVAVGEAGRGVNLRPVSDARNWVAGWLLVLLLDAITGTRVAFAFAPLVMLVVGTAQLRGPAAWMWTVSVCVCVAAWKGVIKMT